MNNDIEQICHNCRICTELLPSQQQEPRVPIALPTAPMTDIGLDFFSFKSQDWLVMACRHSGWIMTEHMRSTTTDATTAQLAKWFNVFGWPLRIRTDGGPQFRNNFSHFCRTHGISHEKSSAFNPESNGLAESSVKQVKRLLEKTHSCLLYTSPSPRDQRGSRMPSSA